MTGSEWLQTAEEHLTARQLTPAWTAFDAAERLGADRRRCCAGRWMTAMLGGDFAAAWRENDAIRALKLPDEHRFWRGEEIRGRRVIVRCLHGLGDAVQMLRYAPMLRERAASVVFEVPPRLLSLAACFRGVEEAITWGELAPRTPPVWEVQVEVMELPYLFRTTQDELPVASRYIEVKAASSAIAARPKPRVGLVWSSGEWDAMRSVPSALLKPLLSVDAVEWWSLQGGNAASEAAVLGLRAACGDGLMAMAAAMAAFDLVVTVDTLAAHMAGAMGVPVWLMLQHAADWRWMTGRDDSPWYPTMRLFRQAVPGDWGGVVATVRQALAQGFPSAVPGL